MLHWKENESVPAFINHMNMPQQIHYQSTYDLAEIQLDRDFENKLVHNSVIMRFDTNKFTPGSWEWAAASVYMDSHYQFGTDNTTSI